jgi:hypothetical protein
MDELVSKLLELIKQKDERIAQLTDIILDRAGYIPHEQVINVDSSPTKVRVGHVPIRDVLNKLEQSHKKPNWAELAKEESEKLELIDLSKEDAKIS